jgi:hypothetical protein
VRPFMVVMWAVTVLVVAVAVEVLVTVEETKVMLERRSRGWPAAKVATW